MPDSRVETLRWILPEGWEASPAGAVDVLLEPRAGVRCDFTLLPGPMDGSRARAMLEVSATGRPTVGLVSVPFLRAR